MNNRLPVTRVLIALNVLAFLYEIKVLGIGVLTGVNDYPNVGVLFPPDVTQNHAYWELISNGFVHASLIHIGFNMLSLWFVGRFIEQIAGSTRMAIIYFVSLIASSLACVFLSPDNASLGASGAIFGLFGGLFAIGFKHGGPGMALVRSNIGILVANLIFTFAVPGISWAAHIGGLVVGFLITYAIYFPPRPVHAHVVDASTGAVLESEFEPPQQQPPHA